MLCFLLSILHLACWVVFFKICSISFLIGQHPAISQSQSFKNSPRIMDQVLVLRWSGGKMIERKNLLNTVFNNLKWELSMIVLLLGHFILRGWQIAGTDWFSVSTWECGDEVSKWAMQWWSGSWIKSVNIIVEKGSLFPRGLYGRVVTRIGYRTMVCPDKSLVLSNMPAPVVVLVTFELLRG